VDCWGWAGATGHRYVLVTNRARRPWRAERGWHRGHRGHAFGGPWILLLLLLLVTPPGIGFLFFFLSALALITMLAIAAVLAGTYLAGLVQSVLPRAERTAPRSPGVMEAARAPYRLSGGSLAARDGLDLYRMRLLEVLKERYVGGQISLADFEARAGRIARDPSARHLD
jgi:hypothetical protein